MTPVRGPATVGAVFALNGRCLLILTVVNLLLVWFMGGAYLLFVVICAVAVLLVGCPVGLVLARLLRGVSAEWVHVTTFAVAGAVLAGPVLATMLRLASDRPIAWAEISGVLAVATVEGALGAGGSRWWSGRPRRVRRGPTDEQLEDEAVSRALDA